MEKEKPLQKHIPLRKTSHTILWSVVIGISVYVYSIELSFAAGESITSLGQDTQKQLQEKQNKIDEINQKIKSYQQIIALKQQQRTSLSSQIQSLEAQSDKIELEMDTTEENINSLDDDLRRLEYQIAAKEDAINGQKGLLTDLMRVYYESSTQQSKFQFIVSSEDSLGMLHTNDWTVDTSRKIQELIDGIQNLQEKLTAQKEELQNKRSEADSLRLQLEQRSGYLEATKQSKETLVVQTQKEEKKYDSLVDDLEEKRKEIEDEINELDSAKVGQLDVSKLPAFNKSTLYFPVANPRKTQGYGKTTFTRWYSFHNGIDFADSIGTPILAADKGRVVATGNNGKYAYGKWVAIDHGNGLVTLYGHLSSQKVSKGESVKRGQVIGLMGSTGYSTGSHVHFSVFASNSFEIVPSKKIGGLLLPTGAHINPTKYLP